MWDSPAEVVASGDLPKDGVAHYRFFADGFYISNYLEEHDYPGQDEDSMLDLLLDEINATEFPLTN